MLYDYTGDWMSCVNDVVCRPSLYFETTIMGNKRFALDV